MRRRSLLARVSLLLLGWAASACRDTNAPVAAPPVAAGTSHPAILWADQALPVDLGPFIDAEGRDTGCRGAITEAVLSLDPARGRYDLHWLGRSSCGGEIIGNSGFLGGYRRTGDALSLEAGTAFAGRVRADDVVVVVDGRRWVFAQPGTPATRLRAGGYALGTVDGIPLPFVDRTWTGGCAPLLTAARLSLFPDSSARSVMGPASGLFELRYVFHGSCDPLQHSEQIQSGTWEQVGAALRIDLPYSTERYRPDWGTVRGDTLVMAYSRWQRESP